MPNDSVLVIEDSGFFVRAYSKVLSEAGYQVLIACDGQSGIQAAQACRPSVIILDLLLPGLSGMDVLKRLKSNPATSYTPVLVVSSLSGANAKNVILEGADGFCEKANVTAEILEKSVSNILKRRVLQP
jgi:CheY-like chemotaxis protein